MSVCVCVCVCVHVFTCVIITCVIYQKTVSDSRHKLTRAILSLVCQLYKTNPVNHKLLVDVTFESI